MKLTTLPSFACAVLSGLLYWLAFAGWDIWPLAFVAFVPLWFALRRQSPKRALQLGAVAGATMNLGGFAWLVGMLQTFSGFPLIACIFFFVVVCTFQGGRIGVMGWLYARAEERRWPTGPVFVAAFATSELVYPLLFPWYYAATVHTQPWLTQSAEVGGPILVGVVLVTANLVLAEPLMARWEKRPIHVRALGGGAVAVCIVLAISAWRIQSIDRRAAASDPVHVGVVQGNLGLLQKRQDPGEGLRRHLRMTEELRQRGADFVVWSESSVTFALPEKMAPTFLKDRVARLLKLPAIFGGVLVRTGPQGERWFNAALSSDAEGTLNGRYDKQFLLAFGEFLPFGETLPILYEWSPNSGHFSPGTLFDPLIIRLGDVDHKVTTLICYEDILPSFTNKLVKRADPELLVNMTNDAWFGDTVEPWEHLALAKFRAIEHRRYLVRGTNSGVSAIVDPVGRIVSQTKTFVPEAIDATIHWMRGSTVYEWWGDGPWMLTTLIAIVMACVQRKRTTSASLNNRADAPPSAAS